MSLLIAGLYFCKIQFFANIYLKKYEEKHIDFLLLDKKLFYKKFLYAIILNTHVIMKT
jgi:hypothetical protein